MREHPTYRILDLLGDSPSTVVHRAWDDTLQRNVAIKMLREEFTAIPHERKVFWERVKAMSSLRHDRLLAVHSHDTERDWVILELADGSAASLLASGPVSTEDVASFVAQAAEGLKALHDSGRLHGRVKPANLLVYKSGRLKVADPGALIDGVLQLTSGGEKYLAPELCDPGRWGDGPPVRQLDFYMLGFCALEMLAGPTFDSLFSGMTAGGVDKSALWWKWHASDEDPRALVAKLIPTAGHPLRTTLERMLTKEVKGRPAFADDIIGSLGKAVPEPLRVTGPAIASAPAVAVPMAHDAVMAVDAAVSAIPLRKDGVPKAPVTASGGASPPSFPSHPGGGLSGSGAFATTLGPLLQNRWLAFAVAGVLLGLGLLFVVLGVPERRIRVKLPPGTGPAAVTVNGEAVSVEQGEFKVYLADGDTVRLGIEAPGCEPLGPADFTLADLRGRDFAIGLNPLPVARTVRLEIPEGAGEVRAEVDGQRVPVDDARFTVMLVPGKPVSIAVMAEGCETMEATPYTAEALDAMSDVLRLVAAPAAYPILIETPPDTGPARLLAGNDEVKIVDGKATVRLMPRQRVSIAVTAEGCEPVPAEEYAASDLAQPGFGFKLQRLRPVAVDRTVRVGVPDGAGPATVMIDGVEARVVAGGFKVSLLPDQRVRIAVSAPGCDTIDGEYSAADLDGAGLFLELVRSKPPGATSGDISEQILF